MPLLNRKVDYALLILCYLHHKTEGGCTREIAARFGLGRPFVANILKDLCQQDFVARGRIVSAINDGLAVAVEFVEMGKVILPLAA